MQHCSYLRVSKAPQHEMFGPISANTAIASSTMTTIRVSKFSRLARALSNLASSKLVVESKFQGLSGMRRMFLRCLPTVVLISMG